MNRKYVELGALVGAAALLTGCLRLGNNVVQNENPDKITGYYESQAQSLELCSQNSPTAKTLCSPVATNLVPAMIGSVLTNPLALIVKDLSIGKAYFVGLNESQPALPVYVDPKSLDLSFIGSTGSEILWADEACTTKLYIEEEGAVIRGKGPFTSGSKLSLSGRVQLEVDVIRVFEGSCSDSLTQMAKCYEHAKYCGGATDAENSANQAWVQSLFDAYIQAGTMTLADIPTVTRTAYHVSYQ